MVNPEHWQKSSYSGGGNACVEVATLPTHIAVRDSKAPARTPLTIPTGAFSTFIEALKPPYSTVTDFARFRG